MIGKAVHIERVAELNGQTLKAVYGKLLGDKTFRRIRKPEPVALSLDGDFPPAGRAQEYLVPAISNELAGTARQARVVRNPPQETDYCFRN